MSHLISIVSNAFGTWEARRLKQALEYLICVCLPMAYFNIQVDLSFYCGLAIFTSIKLGFKLFFFSILICSLKANLQLGLNFPIQLFYNSWYNRLKQRSVKEKKCKRRVSPVQQAITNLRNLVANYKLIATSSTQSQKI
jgi:hypothetical protein